jgi:hypothetical protein
MMHNLPGLYDILNAQRIELDKQIEEVKDDFLVKKHNGPLTHVDSFTVYQAVRPDGVPLLEPLMIARANVLAAMANLKAADMNSKAPRR